MRQNDLEKAFAALVKFGLPTRLFHEPIRNVAQKICGIFQVERVDTETT